MNVEAFKGGLLELETQLSTRTERGHQAARAQVLDSSAYVGDVNRSSSCETCPSVGAAA
jgi:hypothetical protein